ELRRDDPVHYVDVEGFRPFWAITRHADVLEIERDPARFHNTDDVVLQPADADPPPIRTLVQMDGDEHRVFRSLTSGWFRPSGVKALQADIDALAAAAVDRLAACEDAIDVVDEVALPYPLRVIMRIFGLPTADEGLIRRLSEEIFASED